MAEQVLKLLMVASEASPFAKTGGLADVVGSLPATLQALGHNVRLVMPWYRSVKTVAGALRPSRQKIIIPMGGRIYQAAYRATEYNGVQVYFLDIPECYDRPYLYGDKGQDYPDNAERFGILSRGALELSRQVGFCPDVVHAHDWQTGLVPVYLHQKLWRDPFFAKTASLFTIHNLGYQGVFPLNTARQLDLEESLLTPDGLEYHGQLSLLKGGLRFATQVSTVSPTYCREIQTPERGMGLDGLLRSRQDRLHGILNGLDDKLWSPAEDPALAQCYRAGEFANKALCKERLQKELELQIAPRTPVVSMITRLDSQKGIELVLESWDKIMQHSLQLVILGTGNPDYERCLAEAASYYPGQASVLLCFDDNLSRRIYAGSDIFLMPSRYEPCGLGQLIALRYGSIPLVHSTGGLADTITDPKESEDHANGFVFDQYRHNHLLDCLERALSVYQEPSAWQRMVTIGMNQDLSWTQAAERYVDLYHRCKEENHDGSR